MMPLFSESISHILAFEFPHRIDYNFLVFLHSVDTAPHFSVFRIHLSGCSLDLVRGYLKEQISFLFLTFYSNHLDSFQVYLHNLLELFQISILKINSSSSSNRDTFGSR